MKKTKRERKLLKFLHYPKRDLSNLHGSGVLSFKDAVLKYKIRGEVLHELIVLHDMPCYKKHGQIFLVNTEVEEWHLTTGEFGSDSLTERLFHGSLIRNAS